MGVPDIPVLEPPAEMNRESIDVFRPQVEPHLAEDAGPGIVLDLGAVSFINSTALGYVVQVGKDLSQSGRRLALARPQRQIEKLLRMVGLSTVLPHFKSLADAQRHVAAAPLRQG